MSRLTHAFSVTSQMIHQPFVTTDASSAELESETAPHVDEKPTATETHHDVKHAYQNGVLTLLSDRPASAAGVQLAIGEVGCGGADNIISIETSGRRCTG
eukprot:5009840-Prymnesium_polylepis.1